MIAPGRMYARRFYFYRLSHGNARACLGTIPLLDGGMKLSFLPALCLSLALASPALAAGPQAFTFVALGDMPYRDGDIVPFEELIGDINKVAPSFSIHVGDFKPGTGACSDEVFARALRQFQSFDQPLVYTPGDNDWTDCHRPSNGKFDPLERLAKLRREFYADPAKSLGRTKMPIVSQGQAMPAFATYVENARFAKNGVIFATAHIVGSNNGRAPDYPQTVVEFEARDAANVAWITDAFREARDTKAKALVLAWQADNHREGHRPGFAATAKAIEEGAKSFGKPVLVVHGDHHCYRLMPFEKVAGEVIPGVTRLQVPGDTVVDAVRIEVDPDSSDVFSYSLVKNARGC